MTRFTRVVVVAGLTVVGSAMPSVHTSAQSRSGAQAQIVGAWLLQTRTVQSSSGEVLQDPVLGPQPIGRLVYDVSGVVMLTMMRLGRTQPISTPANPDDAGNARVILGYDAYFGTYSVDEGAGTVTHHVEGSLFPEDLGKDFTRSFTIAGDTFTLSFASTSPAGASVTRTLVFRRARSG